MQDIEVLLPRLLTRLQFVAAVSGTSDNLYINDIEKEINLLADNYDCSCLIAGFDSGRLPYIFAINPPGAITDWTNTGHYSVGEGSEIAFARLLNVDYKQSNGIVHTLYDCFDAKVHAELSASVSMGWDACIIYGNVGVKLIKQEIQPLLDKVWAQRNRSPFKKTKDPDDLPKPPRDWEKRMRMLVAESLGTAIDADGQLREL